MKKGRVYFILALTIIISFIVVLLMYSNSLQNVFTGRAVSNASCTPSWQCTDWSECIGGIQIRSCVDFNTCGDNSTKPSENQSCITCTPNWECGDWGDCVDGIQTKDCTDLNGCGTIMGKPAETKSCTYELDIDWLFFVIVSILILMIIVNIILIIKQWKKINEPIAKETNIRTNIQPRRPLYYPPK